MARFGINRVERRGTVGAVSWAMTATDLQRLQVELTTLRPDRILECGTGESTRLLTSLCPDVTSLEHLAEYAAPAQTYGGTVLCGPIIDTAHGPFYEVTLDGPYDFVLIDGPPGVVGRHGTLPNIWPHLSDRAVVWLDDVSRPAERNMLFDWSLRYGLSVTVLSDRVARLTRT